MKISSIKKPPVLDKAKSFLMAKALSGGLEISDSSLRFISLDGGTPKTVSLRLAPGVLGEGRVLNRKEFVKALRALRQEILGAKSKRRALINVIVSLSSVNVYTQVFRLPPMTGEALEKAVQLNIQMASPGASAGDNYAGWQILEGGKESDATMEILAAFLPREIADDLASALKEAGFMATALESRAISLARLIRSGMAGVEKKDSVIVVSSDSSGLDVMIIREGRLYFDYFKSWRDLQGDERQISLEMFRTLVVRAVNQVMNFYEAHWKDGASQILVATPGLKQEMLTAIDDSFETKVSELIPIDFSSLSPDWYISLGGALRSLRSRREDTAISLLGIGAKEEFQREQVQNFFDFWKVLIPATMAVVLAFLAVAWFFLGGLQEEASARATSLGASGTIPELAELKSNAAKFNSEVAMLNSINSAQKIKGDIFETILEIVSRRGIDVERLVIGNPSSPITIKGVSFSEEDIIAFKNELLTTPGISGVNLPLTDIRKQADAYSFSISFNFTPGTGN